MFKHNRHLADSTLRAELLLGENHPQSEDEHEQAVARVTEHHREQKRKRDDRVRR